MIKPSGSGGISEEAVDSIVEEKLSSNSYTDTATSGTDSKTEVIVNVSPTANSTRVVFAQKIEINYSGNFNISTGGWLTASEKVINVSGTGTKDKLVADMTQLNLTGGNIAAAVGYEPAIASIAASTLVGGYAGYYFPNLAGVANISNITTLACLSNDEPRAMIRSAGPYVNADLREVSPSEHIGLIAGRYYSSPAKSMATPTAAVANVIYVTYVHIPQRTTITKLGCEVTTGVSGNVRLGMYKVANGMLTTLVTQTSNISTTTLGVKEGTVSSQVDSGVYAIVAVFSATPTIRWHEINNHSMMGAATAAGYSEQAYITPFPFGALPATANIVPTFAAEVKEPHLWYRVGV